MPIFIHLHFNHVIQLQPDEDGTFILNVTKYELNRRSLQQAWQDIPDVTCWSSLGYWRTLGELILSEGRAYNLCFDPARGECR